MNQPSMPSDMALGSKLNLRALLLGVLLPPLLACVATLLSGENALLLVREGGAPALGVIGLFVLCMAANALCIVVGSRGRTGALFGLFVGPALLAAAGDAGFWFGMQFVVRAATGADDAMKGLILAVGSGEALSLRVLAIVASMSLLFGSSAALFVIAKNLERARVDVEPRTDGAQGDFAAGAAPADLARASAARAYASVALAFAIAAAASLPAAHFERRLMGAMGGAAPASRATLVTLDAPTIAASVAIRIVVQILVVLAVIVIARRLVSRETVADRARIRLIALLSVVSFATWPAARALVGPSERALVPTTPVRAPPHIVLLRGVSGEPLDSRSERAAMTRGALVYPSWARFPITDPTFTNLAARVRRVRTEASAYALANDDVSTLSPSEWLDYPRSEVLVDETATRSDLLALLNAVSTGDLAVICLLGNPRPAGQDRLFAVYAYVEFLSQLTAPQVAGVCIHLPGSLPAEADSVPAVLTFRGNAMTRSVDEAARSSSPEQTALRAAFGSSSPRARLVFDESGSTEALFAALAEVQDTELYFEPAR